jgi:hypothetical protein
VRRVAASIVGLFVGTLLLVGLKSTAFAPPGSLVAGAPQDPGGSPGAATGPASSPGRPPAGQPTPTHAPPGGPTQPGQSPRPGQSTTTTTPGGGGTTTTTTTTSASTTYVGSAASVPTATSPNAPRSGGTCGECHNYAISVTITVSGGQITAASYAYSVDPGGSRYYANRACQALQPLLLSRHTWNLGKPVSGATYAVNAFEQSARSAMQKAGLPV